MPDIKQKVKAKASAVISDIVNGLSQSEAKNEDGAKDFDSADTATLLRDAASRGSVLLKNDGVLPLNAGERLSVFGRVQLDWFYTGYGSGGDVVKPYAVNLIEGIRGSGCIKLNERLCDRYEQWVKKNPADHGFWGHWPRFHPEMPLSDSEIKDYSSFGGVAAVVIGRSSGEDRENVLEKGSYYITDEELSLISRVTRYFEKTVILLNIGSVIDLSWLKRFSDKIGAVLLLWQGGMESGNAAADMLCGKNEPSGRLSDTIVKDYKAYPSSDCFGAREYNCYKEDIYVGYRWFETFDKESVLFPFGYGLSYTSFVFSGTGVQRSGDSFTVSFTVTNTGDRAGRQTAQLYVEKPCTKEGNPARCLVGFYKTAYLQPGEEEKCSVSFSVYDIAHYDENLSAYVTGEKYVLYLGENVRDARKIYGFELENSIVCRVSENAAPVKDFQVYTAKEGCCGRRNLSEKPVKTRTVSLKNKIIENLPGTIVQKPYNGVLLSDVKEGKISMESFVSMLSKNELEALTRGDYTMNSPLGAPGNAGALGGVTSSLRNKGVPPVTTTDGPSGIRLSACCSLIPVGTLLACTFDTALVQQVYGAVAREMKERGSDVLLAPGMNIHRNPLCGRNFEYYSEDPLLTGKIAAAAVRGIQSTGLSACPKHFACNSQETNRNKTDSVVSERALREIYLKGFEICVKEGFPKCIMTSYNKVNGVWSHYHYELCTCILRGEWGYGGCVITDWWMQYTVSPEFRKIRDNAYRVRAQVDVLMPGGGRSGKRKPDGTLLESLGKKEGITLGEIQRSAMNVLRFAMNKI